MNFFAFLCELVFICVWNYETPLTSPVSQMRFFQPGTTYSQSDVFLVFSQSHDCRPTRGTLPRQEYSIFSAHFELLFGNRKKKRKVLYGLDCYSRKTQCHFGLCQSFIKIKSDLWINRGLSFWHLSMLTVRTSMGKSSCDLGKTMNLLSQDNEIIKSLSRENGPKKWWATTAVLGFRRNPSFFFFCGLF